MIHGQFLKKFENAVTLFRYKTGDLFCPQTCSMGMGVCSCMDFTFLGALFLFHNVNLSRQSGLDLWS